ncbi:hypothetical protein TNCT_350701 [Trichonephila clavata]|uniref:Uncharacterized protein n=1 Tax=Trichonephila clavata TaxID=2740835 RepID=A0A8X6H770_TRICU|nr:hypothetical protein TNCT_350701 [Trichonephila clavata]
MSPFEHSSRFELLRSLVSKTSSESFLILSKRSYHALASPAVKGSFSSPSSSPFLSTPVHHLIHQSRSVVKIFPPVWNHPKKPSGHPH